MTDTREQRIREEAFLLWNAEGRPDGKTDEYWHRAKAVIERMEKLTEEERQRGDL
jgi:hypothetical protein